jgi:hypothetical protein
MTKPTFNIENNPNPADRHMAITPNDATVLDPIPRALKVTVAGNLAIADADGTAITYTVTAGDIIPFRATKVLLTGTTATVVAWY